MAKTKRKKTQKSVSAAKTKKTVKDRKLAVDYVNHLQNLHKMQGALLNQLQKCI